MQDKLRTKSVLLHNFIITFLFCAIVIYGYFWAKPSGEEDDQRNYHLPQIEVFVEQPSTKRY